MTISTLKSTHGWNKLNIEQLVPEIYSYILWVLGLCAKMVSTPVESVFFGVNVISFTKFFKSGFINFCLTQLEFLLTNCQSYFNSLHMLEFFALNGFMHFSKEFWLLINRFFKAEIILFMNNCVSNRRLTNSTIISKKLVVLLRHFYCKLIIFINNIGIVLHDFSSYQLNVNHNYNFVLSGKRIGFIAEPLGIAGKFYKSKKVFQNHVR